MNTLMIILFTGVVDRVVDNFVTAEVENSEDVVIMAVSDFPCLIQEGESFYLVRYDGQTKILCGEPPE